MTYTSWSRTGGEPESVAPNLVSFHSSSSYDRYSTCSITSPARKPQPLVIGGRVITTFMATERMEISQYGDGQPRPAGLDQLDPLNSLDHRMRWLSSPLDAWQDHSVTVEHTFIPNSLALHAHAHDIHPLLPCHGGPFCTCVLQTAWIEGQETREAIQPEIADSPLDDHVPSTTPPQLHDEMLLTDALLRLRALEQSTYESSPKLATDGGRIERVALPISTQSPTLVSDAQGTVRCYQHSCAGRTFSSLGNYIRHVREKSGVATRFMCRECGQTFTRSTAKRKHESGGRCRV